MFLAATAPPVLDEIARRASVGETVAVLAREGERRPALAFGDGHCGVVVTGCTAPARRLSQAIAERVAAPVHLVDERAAARANLPADALLLHWSEELSIAFPVMCAGEVTSRFGHVSDDLSGPLCRCGSRGCLEQVASTRHLTATWQSLTGSQVDISSLADIIASGHPTGRRLLRHAAERVATSLAPVCAATNAHLVVISGPLSAAGQALTAPVLDQLRRAWTADVQVEAAEVHDVLRSASLLALGSAPSSRLHPCRTVRSAP